MFVEIAHVIVVDMVTVRTANVQHNSASEFDLDLFDDGVGIRHSYKTFFCILKIK